MEMQPLDSENSLSQTTKLKKKGCHQLLIQILCDFAENTTLNGLKYMAEKGTSLLERLFWITTFFLSAALCFMMVYRTYIKWETSGVIITLKEHLVYVNELPFPAVTICPQARIRQNLYNYTKIGAYSASTRERPSNELHSVMVFCDEEYSNNTVRDPVDLHDVRTNIETFFKVAPRHEDIFEECAWRNTNNCEDAFRPVLTADGVCFTFNTLAADEIFRKKSVQGKLNYLNTTTRRRGWSHENNYHNSDQDTYPRRGRGNGASEDLYIALKEVTDRDFACDGHTQLGYKVYLHHPADLPQASLHYYAAQPERTTSFALKLNILDTANELENYKPDIRQCYYPSERRLQFFKKYTSKNCQFECLTNYTLQICGCVGFYMPRNISTKICKTDRYLCVQKALDEYAVQEGMSESDADQCRCLPSCSDIHYDAEIILTKFDQREYDKKSEALNALVAEIYEDYEVDYGESDYDDGNYDENAKEEGHDSVTNRSNVSANNATNQTVSQENENTDYENSVNETDISNDNDTSNSATANSMLTIIRIYYRQPRFVAMERSELFGLSQFLADCGGNLGLFLGFSVLTLAEIVYFFTLKLFCNLRRDTVAEETKKSNGITGT